MSAKRKSRVKVSVSDAPATPLVLGAYFLQVLVVNLFLLFAAENEPIARAFFSRQLWATLIQAIGAQIHVTPDGFTAQVPVPALSMLSVLLCGLPCMVVAVVTKSRGSKSGLLALWSEAVITNTRWTIPLAVWTGLWILNLLVPGMPLAIWLLRTVPMAVAAVLAGWLWEILRLLPRNDQTAPQTEMVAPSSRARWIVAAGIGIYVAVFVTMNFGLWFNLQIPHGDSSMYEEHLWNTLHGKGFRSYLDQGLFLGEHVQVIHLFLLPVYALLSSHLLLEFCGSAAVALGAVPVFLMARRHAKSEQVAAIVAAGYLLYFPLQYLDISVDLKTFRPSAFGIPALLFAFHTAEVRRYGWMTFCLLLALASQEDFATVIAPFGLWMCLTGLQEFRRSKEIAARNQLVIGGVICVAATAYVITVVKVILPWFRSGAAVHYVSYFDAFGKTPAEIVVNLITRPDLVWQELITAGTLALFLHLLQPAGFPFRAWSRLLVGLPLFVLLAANQLTKDFPGPFHHFHAPIIPVIAWAMASAVGSGLAAGSDFLKKTRERGLWILASALATGLFFSISPLGIKFWDVGGTFYWARLYVPDERAHEFAHVLAAIPQTAKVASTDFIHPRFTHYERSYDYSHYPRKVADNEDKVPDDTDYIVIDTRHRYSEIQKFEEMREFRNQRDQWEVVPIDTKGYFIVLKRVKYPEKTPVTEGQP